MNKMEEQIWQILASVNDPEIPVLSIVDLGIVRSVSLSNASQIMSETEVAIKVTPTYSACPAVDLINEQIRTSLTKAGFQHIRIEQTLFPAWTTDWMSESGKEKLKGYGIAPPIGKSCDHSSLQDLKVLCPQCGSNETRIVSEFGSTACKALFQCIHCLEPFDYFKCH